MTVTAPSSTSRLRAAAWPLAAAAGTGVVVLALHLRDPHVQNSWGVCPLFAATGVYCPGCGGLRAVNDVTNGDFLAALSSNALIYPAGVVVAWLWLIWLGRRVGFTVPAVPQNKYLWITVGVLVLVWTVARNFPGSPLAP
ncbi:hypothetical protein TPB0596_02080 [Tsukamurella pulmonis]|uniref:DUF2752 domain-containing protein n=1 Tax=Tsukamurella pulmonis TaxID=47312 RepID=UPI001EDCA08F|nr:DUF2752 domain-containing protein [Tsukamurella pulmonis]BDD80445.1 hypothetical protein TPB0596_02080 [Tsukamurella pulmonis]